MSKALYISLNIQILFDFHRTVTQTNRRVQKAKSKHSLFRKVEILTVEKCKSIDLNSSHFFCLTNQIEKKNICCNRLTGY